jgi:hypothetical protein
MLGNLSIIGAVAAIIMIPTAVFAQVGGAITPVSTLGALLIPARPFAVQSSEVSLVQIWELGARRVGKFTVAVSILPQSSAVIGADRYGQASLLVRARSSAERRCGS